MSPALGDPRRNTPQYGRRVPRPSIINDDEVSSIERSGAKPLAIRTCDTYVPSRRVRLEGVASYLYTKVLVLLALKQRILQVNLKPTVRVGHLRNS